MRIQIKSKLFELYFCFGDVYDPVVDELSRKAFNIRFGRYSYDSTRGWRNLKNISAHYTGKII